MRQTILAAALAVTVAAPVDAALVTFDFAAAAMPAPDDPTGRRSLPLEGFPGFGTFTGDRGRQLDVVVLTPGGQRRAYRYDNFGSGPDLAFTNFDQGIDPNIQRPLFGFGTETRNEAQFVFQNPVRLLSLTFALYAEAPNIEVRARRAGETITDNFDFFFSGGPPNDGAGIGPNDVPPRRTVTFEPTDPLRSQITMFSKGVPGAALVSITVDDPSLAPIPLPAAAWMLLGGLGALGAVARRRRAA